MKHLKYLLLALPLILLASCSDDDDYPALTFNDNISGYYSVDGDNTLYVTPDDLLRFNSLTVSDADGHAAIITTAAYGINGMLYRTVQTPPFTCSIPTDMFAEGNNYVTIDMTIAVTGYPILVSGVSYKVTLVADEADLPEGAVYVP